MTLSTGCAMSSDVPEKGGRLAYVLITTARNESSYIEMTLKSVVRQTVPPVKWLIVSDGSTDGTDDIVMRYATEYKWIELMRMPRREERHFAGKAFAFNAAYEKVKSIRYDIVGNLDADTTVEEDYFAFLLDKFAENPLLGVGGTAFTEGSRQSQYDYRFSSVEHVPGMCQMFRRECFESIGGYVPRKIGGIDLVAVLTARMMGWQTRAFLEKTCFHHRKMGTGMSSRMSLAFRYGRVDYMLGGHPLWEICRSIYHMKSKPFIIGGCLRLIGFFCAMLAGVEKEVPKDLIEFRRKDQMLRLASILKSFFPRGLKRPHG